ncbi:hypothetical protein BH09PLA1_BH09PLA1_05300 [soil metagenome]
MFQLIQVLYWLALSTWFGGVLFIAVAAPVIFRTINEADPTLPRVLSVNLDKQHSTLLAGSIVANLLNLLVRVQLACAGVLLLTMLVQWRLIDHAGPSLWFAILRSAMYIAAVALAIYNWRVVWPRVKNYRQEYIDHADEPDIANPAKENFDRYQDESVTVLRNILFLLLGIILFSGDISVRAMTFNFQG